MSVSPSNGSGATAVAAGIALIAAVLLLAESWAPRGQLDDSFITYRYAQNLVDGHGLVWNPGERVEGITNLLWTLLVAAGLGLGTSGPVAGHVLGVLSGVALLVASTALAVAGVPRRALWIAALAPWVLLASPAVPYFATSGMETHAFLALCVGALAAHAHGRMGLATVFICLGIAIRPDAGIVATAVLGAHLLESGPSRARSWAPVAVFAASVIALTAFRLAYYGSPVPNTFHTKVGGIPLAMSLRAATTYLLEGPIALVVPAALAARRDRRALAPLSACAATLLYAIASGGTGLTFSRLLALILPLLAALACRTTAVSVARGDRLAPLWLGCLAGSAAGYIGGMGSLCAAVAAGAAIAALYRPAQGAPSTLRAAVASLAVVVAVAGAVDAASENVSRGQRLRGKRFFDLQLFAGARRSINRLRRAEIAPGSLVAASAIGVIGYYSDYLILDLLGLTDPVISRSSDSVRGAVGLGQGHIRSNADYVLERAPAVIMISEDRGPDHEALTAVRALWEHPGLTRDYEWDPKLRAWRRRTPPPG